MTQIYYSPPSNIKHMMKTKKVKRGLQKMYPTQVIYPKRFSLIVSSRKPLDKEAKVKFGEMVEILEKLTEWKTPTKFNT